jgi:hypothetical protein
VEGGAVATGAVVGGVVAGGAVVAGAVGEGVSGSSAAASIDVDVAGVTPFDVGESEPPHAVPSSAIRAIAMMGRVERGGGEPSMPPR